jgi:nitroreductase/NAD-dependent dihydropyrimidine dehydrogenase PreA subunit
MTIIRIDKDLCTNCGICSEICSLGIISSGKNDEFPDVLQERESFCIRCGHCAISCPSRALILDFRQEEPEPVLPSLFPPEPDFIAYYLKNRRSVRHYTKKLVSRETIEDILDIARYAPSGGNQQPVNWLVIHDPGEVKRLAGLTIDWMRYEAAKDHPIMPRPFLDRLIAAWDHGSDPITREAPHLLIAIVPEGPGSASIDGIIAVTYADIAAPAFGVGTCWAGFLSIAVHAWQPLKDALAIPKGYVYSYALMCGHPKFKTYGIPPRNSAKVTWR